MAQSDWGHRLSAIAPGGECNLCGHTGTPRDPVLAVHETATGTTECGRPYTEHWTTYRCEDAFACQERRAKAGAAW